MATLYSTLGKLHGSFGNITARRHYDQSTRAIVSQKANQVKNPRSEGQAMQRLKMPPIVKTYSRLQDIINHSFQGLSFGMSNYAAFLKANTNAFQGPFLVKGTNIVVPGPFEISRGSLVGFTPTKTSDMMSYFATGIQVGDFTIGATSTMGQLATAILENNEHVQEGDQITLVGAIHIDRRFDWNYSRILLNKQDATIIQDSPIGGIISVYSGVLGYSVYEDAIDRSLPVICGGVIVSRFSTTQNMWLRSTCKLQMFDLSPTYYGHTAYLNAVKSYMGTQVEIPAISEWYLNGNTLDNKYGFFAIVPKLEVVAIDNVEIFSLALGVSLETKTKVLGLTGANGKVKVYSVSNKTLSPSVDLDKSLVDAFCAANNFEYKEIAAADLKGLDALIK